MSDAPVSEDEKALWSLMCRLLWRLHYEWRRNAYARFLTYQARYCVWLHRRPRALECRIVHVIVLRLLRLHPGDERAWTPLRR